MRVGAEEWVAVPTVQTGAAGAATAGVDDSGSGSVRELGLDIWPIEDRPPRMQDPR